MFSETAAELYNKEITKEELENVPTGHFEGDIITIEDHESAHLAIEKIQQETILGFDTETRPSFKKGETHSMALIQIATASQVFLFRITKVGYLPGLWKILSDKNILKAGIGLENDIRDLSKIHPLKVANLIDLNSECAKLGFKVAGVRKLSALILGIKPSKTQQTSNWEAIELTQAQKNYAATDAWVCREITLRLMGIQ
ncbi:MAG: 3'-5' exonuclease domain-containing protein 2 [Sphingobacteriia bacterium]|nr:3'-5' exonuclease domain-containing protein 2 [Sphingobacteriia bacterium]